MLGISYPGFLAMMAGIDANPAVKAISPQAPMTNIWMGDDFFHNGAFRETYGFDYVQGLEAQKTNGFTDSKEDQYDFFLKHGNFAGAAKTCGDGEAADGEGVSGGAELCEVLAGYGGRAAFEAAGGSYAGGGRVLGPGRYVGDAGGVCGAAGA